MFLKFEPFIHVKKTVFSFRFYSVLCEDTGAMPGVCLLCSVKKVFFKCVLKKILTFFKCILHCSYLTKDNKSYLIFYPDISNATLKVVKFAVFDN